MAKFIAKPVPVDAVQYDLDTGNVAPDGCRFIWRGGTRELYCRTPGGEHIVNPGNWIVTHANGDRIIWREDLFWATYREA